MKKIALVLSIIVATLVLASCANKGTDQTTVSSDTQSQVVTTKSTKHHHHRHHHDYKGEAAHK